MPHHTPPLRAVVITLTRNEITFAVDFETAKVAQMQFMSADEKYKDHAENTITGPETKDWLDRQIEDAYQILKAKSRPYIDTIKCRIVKDTIDWTKCEWVICLNMPCEWRGEADELVSQANRFVVAYVLEQWYAMVEPQVQRYRVPRRVDTYQQRQVQALSDYRDTLNKQLVRTQFM
jgi:hypothetical protein